MQHREKKRLLIILSQYGYGGKLEKNMKWKKSYETSSAANESFTVVVKQQVG